MKVYNVYEGLERLWKNAELHLESQFDSMLEYLVKHSSSESENRAFNYIIENADLENIVHPLKLWKNYLTFRIGFKHSHEHFKKRALREYITPILIDIILAENQLLLLKKYGDQLIEPNKEYDCKELERQFKKWLVIIEYHAANIIEDNLTKASLYRTFYRNATSLGSKRDVYFRQGVDALCGEIICNLKAKLPISDEYIGKRLLELKKIINTANRKKVKLPFNSRDTVFALHRFLQKMGSHHSDSAYKLSQSIKVGYKKS